MIVREKELNKIVKDNFYLNSVLLEMEGVCGCLLVIRRIRNNMMHGLKAVSELDKQIELFRSANEVLESIRCRK